MAVETKNEAGEFLSYEEHLKEWRIRQGTYQSMSLVLHLAIALAFLITIKTADKLMEDDITDAVNLGQLVNIEPIAMISPPAVVPVYDKNGDVVIKLPLKRPPKRKTKADVLNGLLSKLRGSSVNVAKQNQQSSFDAQASQINASGLQSDTNVALNTSQGSSRADMWKRLKMARAGMGGGGGPGGPNLMKYITQHYNKFQSCYEKALLVDPSLAVKTTLVMALNNGGKFRNGKVRFRGQGSASSKSKLKGCLIQEMGKISFPTDTKKVRFKFNLIFKS